MILGAFEEQITEAVEKLSESVVSIESTSLVRGYGRRIPIGGSGSGLVFRKDGYIITNNHVVDGADHVDVALKNGNSLRGEIVGTDPLTDVALVRVRSDAQLVPAPLGDSEKLKVGQLALAIGNSLGLPGGPTVSAGVVSAIGRQLPGTDFILEGFLQTDAAINPGNSGGPLADTQGRVIGTNTAMIPFAKGVGFAIPINTVRYVAELLLEKGRMVRPWLGISGVSMSREVSRRFGIEEVSGVLVMGVIPGSPGYEAGLRIGDVIARVGSSEIGQMKDILSALSKLEIGQRADLSVRRRGFEKKISLRLVEMPEGYVSKMRQ